MIAKITNKVGTLFEVICEHHQYYLLLGVLVVHLTIGLVMLDELPGQWFGDISIVNDYVQSIINGQNLYKFATSAGPLYFYLIAPIIAKGGSSYLLYKFLSVMVGCFNIVATYLFARSISNKKIAITTAFVMSVSFWHIVWSRLGNFNIITPGIVAASMLFFMRYTRTHSERWIWMSYATATCGLLIYAGTFVLPTVMFLLFGYELYRHRHKLGGRHLLTVVVLYVIGISITLYLIVQNIENFSGGYLGEKLRTSMQHSYYENAHQLLINIWRTATMLHIEGDVVFRWNVPKMPHLDWVSGVCFLVGLWNIVRGSKQRIIYILIPLLLLPIPSLLPGHPPAEVPSSPRNMMIMPMVYLMVAIGLNDVHRALRRYTGRTASTAFILIIIGAIVLINLYRYFVRYPAGLPNKNIPYGRAVAEKIDSLTTDYVIYLGSVGWGEWGQPDFSEVFWSLRDRSKDIRQRIPNCSDLKSSRSIVFFDSSKLEQMMALASCSQGKIVRYARENSVIYWTLESK
ncbi:MAG: glycosyltransferase family 39 protein [bacterium]